MTTKPVQSDDTGAEATQRQQLEEATSPPPPDKAEHHTNQIINSIVKTSESNKAYANKLKALESIHLKADHRDQGKLKIAITKVVHRPGRIKKINQQQKLRQQKRWLQYNVKKNLEFVQTAKQMDITEEIVQTCIINYQKKRMIEIIL